MWTCPKCGHRFVTRNMWHSCSNYTLRHHFARKPHLLSLFRQFVKLIRRSGPVTVIPQKSRIVLMVRVRFAGVTVRRDSMEAGLWLMRRPERLDKRIRWVQLTPTVGGVKFRLASAADLGEPIPTLVREAYRVGCQEHLGHRGRAARGARSRA